MESRREKSITNEQRFAMHELNDPENKNPDIERHFFTNIENLLGNYMLSFFNTDHVDFNFGDLEYTEEESLIINWKSKKDNDYFTSVLNSTGNGLSFIKIMDN